MPTNGNGTENGTHDWQADTQPQLPPDLLGDRNDEFRLRWPQIEDRDEPNTRSSPGDAGTTTGENTNSLKRTPTITWRDRGIIALICACFAVLTGMPYFFFIGIQHVFLWSTFPVVMAALAWWLTLPAFKLQYQRSPSGRQKVVPVTRGNYNFLGDKLNRHRYIFTDRETEIVFADKLPLIQGIILIGPPVLIFVPSCWAALGFPGHRMLGQFYVRFPWEMGLATMLALVVAAIWLFYGIKEPPLNQVEQQQEQSRTIKLGKWKFDIRPWHLKFGWIVGLICVWGIYRWPLGDVFLHWFELNPYAVAWLIAIPSALWATMRWMYYLGSYIIVTNMFIRTGSTGYLLGGNPKASMERSDTTNASTYQTEPGKRLGYFMMSEEGIGQLDAEFKRLRIIHGHELENAIAG